MTDSVSKMAKTPKQKMKAKLAEAKKKIKDLIALAKSNTPTALTQMQSATTALKDTITNLVEDEIKNQTGFSLQEIQYKCGEGIKLFRQYKELHQSNKNEAIEKDTKAERKKKRQEKLKERKAQAKAKLQAWLNKQTDPVYNAFVSLSIKDIIDKIAVSMSYLQDSGKDILQSSLENIKSIKDEFKDNGGKVDIQQTAEKIKSSIPLSDIGTKTLDEYTIGDFLSEMQRTSKNENGMDFINVLDVDAKPLTEMNKTLLKLLDNLNKVLPMLYTLIDYYQTNKESLRKNAAEKSIATLKNNAKNVGLNVAKKYKPSKSKIGKTNPENDLLSAGLNDNVDLNKATQVDDMNFMKVVLPIDDANEKEIFDGKYLTEDETPIGFEYHNTECDEVFVCSDTQTVLASELNRISFLLDERSKICKYDENKPVVSLSSQTNGGIIKNLEFAGNSRRELISAILEINNGERL